MTSAYDYDVTISNEFLGESKYLHARSPEVLNDKISAQRKKWFLQERREKERRAKAQLRQSARDEVEATKQKVAWDSEAAQQSIEEWRTLLISAIGRRSALDWEQMEDRAEFPSIVFERKKPDLDELKSQILGPKPIESVTIVPEVEKPHFFEWLLPFLRDRRIARESEARRQYKAAVQAARDTYKKEVAAYQALKPRVVQRYKELMADYESAFNQARTTYLANRRAFLAKQTTHNDEVASFRSGYESGQAETIERYFDLVLQSSDYPAGFDGEPATQFDEASQTLIINFDLPRPRDLPRVTEYRYVTSRKEIKTVEMKVKEFDQFYDDVLQQMTLRVLHEVFASDYAGVVPCAVFNGWISDIDAKTGKPYRACIISCRADAVAFHELDLRHVSPKECVRGLRGITAGPLAMLAPVTPILNLNRFDERFVESKGVVANLAVGENLATMDWEDFEHLVRELFAEEFSTAGSEVRVTQASHDRGVDAIAFDPDPIRGGKFVIQAKRYNAVVPVSAVRDLYGTMMNEGASRGILVTTSYYGRDSRDFAENKPITLIDGENLIAMFAKYGRNLHIALTPSAASRRQS